MTPEERTERALRYHSGALQMFARNGRWGTCVECPQVGFGCMVLPELCKNTDRYDHHLDMKMLCDNWYHTYTR